MIWVGAFGQYAMAADTAHVRLGGENLRSSDILPAHLGMTGQLRDNYICGVKVPLNPKKVFLLNRPGEKKCVAVAVEQPSGAYLNPVDEFDYGSIPVLERLSDVQAQQLWGSSDAKLKTKDYTFLLETKDKVDVFIDTGFSNHQLIKYRVRSSQFANDNWVSLKSPTLPKGSPKPDVD